MGMLTPRDVAAHYSVSVESVRRWIRSGRLTAIPVTPRSYRIRHEDLDTFENEDMRYVNKKKLAKRPITFGEAIDMYVSRLKETGKDSVPVKIAFHLIKERFKGIRINYYNNTELLDEFAIWKQQLILEGKKPATINRYTAIVRTTMNLLKKLNMIQDNPITPFKFPRLKHYPRDRILSFEEENRLLETVKSSKPYLFPLVQFCLVVPSRWKCELLYATIEQYQRENNVVFIPANCSKTKIPMYKPVPKELQDYFNGLPTTQRYIFFDKRISCGTVWRDFKKCCVDADIEDSFTLHDLRHCAVSKLVNNGNNSWDICSVTGWTTPSQLTTYYHLDRLTSASRLKF